MQDQIYDMLMKKDEVSWQTILYDLVKSEQMDPWDVNVTEIAAKYLETVKQRKESNMFLSGKMILAASILLKLKSRKLVDGDLANFDSKLFYQEPEDLQDLEIQQDEFGIVEMPKLTVRTPQARKRKVSINDLVTALDKALRVSERKQRKREMFSRPVEMTMPEKKIDVSSMIKNVYETIMGLFKEDKNKKIKFSHLIPSDRKEDKIFTFIPILHLTNQEKVSVHQENHFQDFDIFLPENLNMQEATEEVNNNLQKGGEING